jgi:hypothetical protein
MATLEDLTRAEKAARHTLHEVAEIRQALDALMRTVAAAADNARITWERTSDALAWARTEDRYLSDGCPSDTHCVRCPDHLPPPPRPVLLDDPLA